MTEDNLVNGDSELDGETQAEACFALTLIEALVFASEEPVGLEELVNASSLSREEALRALSELQARFQAEEYGFELIQVAGKYQFRTKPQFARFIRILKEESPRKLSPAALETLAIVAYRQPVVKSDMEKIRGVDVSPTLKTLLDRRLIKISGHQSTVGQPALYGTTEEFLKVFGLNSLSELPTLRDLKELEKEPGEIGVE